MKTFKQGTPPGCPADNTPDASGTIFRACDTNPPSEEDLTSHAHSTLARKRRNVDPAKCTHWGLSVWITEQDVQHARELHDWIQRKTICKLAVTPSDGKLAQTGASSHHTFWPYEGVDLASRFEIFLSNV